MEARKNVIILCISILFLFSVPLFSQEPAEKPVEKEEPSKFDISKFLFNRFFIDVRAGVDYFYIDPGLLIPKDGKVA
ncbi:MAG: hypothetical protein GY754_12960, partial [bacterium]|nr:hypothetical protein [bacterium]